MKSIRDILKAKGNEIYSVSPADTVFTALEKMAEFNIGALLVLENGRMEGIFSERDYARKVKLKGHSSQDTEVREIMSSRIFFVHPSQSIEDCMLLMNENKIRHLPVVEDDKKIGMISIGDVVKSVIQDKNLQIDELQRYITGRR